MLKPLRFTLWTIPFLIFFSIIPFTPLKVYMHFMYLIAMWIALCEGLNIMVGFTGYMSLGQVAFYGLGVFITSILISFYNLNPYLAMVAAVLLTTLFSGALGWLTLRLRGPYFALTTLALSVALQIIFQYLFPFGITLPPGLYEPLVCHYGIMVIAFVSILLAYAVKNSKIGIAASAIKEDEDAAETLGVNVAKYKVIVFMISATLTAMVGGLDVYRTTYTIAIAAFYQPKNVSMIAMTMFGGAGTIIGPIVGAVILYTIEHIIWANFPLIHLTIYGLIIIAVVLILPEGIIGLLRKKLPSLSKFIV